MLILQTLLTQRDVWHLLTFVQNPNNFFGLFRICVFTFLSFFLCRNQLTLLQIGQQCLLSLHPPTSTARPRRQLTAAVPGGCRGADWCKDWPISVHPAAASTRAPTVVAAVISQTQVSRCDEISSSSSECTLALF